MPRPKAQTWGVVACSAVHCALVGWVMRPPPTVRVQDISTLPSTRPLFHNSPLPSFSWSQQEPSEVASSHATDGETEAGAWSKGMRGAVCPCPKPSSSLPGSQVGATGWAPFAITRNLIPRALNPDKTNPMYHISGLGLFKYHEISKPCSKETSTFLLENVYEQKIIIFKIAREGETSQF